MANFSQSVGQVASWSDTNCNNQFMMMCETKPPAIVQAPLFNASTGAIFAFNPLLKTYDDAWTWCKTAGGHLAGYTSLAEQVRAGYLRWDACTVIVPPCNLCTRMLMLPKQ